MLEISENGFSLAEAEQLKKKAEETAAQFNVKYSHILSEKLVVFL